jgi:hypothetical protein
MIALIPVINRYGHAIEYDLLHEFNGVDLHQFFRGERPWTMLSRLLQQLPPSSRFVIAKRDDPEMALEVARAMRNARASGKGQRYRPPAAEWNTTAELTAAVVDRLGEVVTLLQDLPIAGKKRKAKPPKPVARPESAIERAERELSDEHVNEIIADVENAKVSVQEYQRIAAEVEAARAVASQEQQADA